MKPKLTNEGIAAQIRALSGEGITFSKIKLGNGDAPNDYKILTDLQNPLADAAFTSMVAEEETGYVQLESTFTNANLASAFYWKEVGIFITDPDDQTNDLLYAYGHVDIGGTQETASSIPAAADEDFELTLTYRVYVGEADNLSAMLAESSIYATKTAFKEHTADRDNPHHVTAEDVGLGNVDNVPVDELSPTVTEAASLTPLSAGDVMSVIISKAAKAISTLISHLSDSTVHISQAERTAWNSKAAASHNHSASQITSGTLGMARGGTGAQTAAAAAKNLLASGADGIGGKMLFKPGTGNAYSLGGMTAAKKTAWRLIFNSLSSPAGTGYVEIATGGEGNEPVCVRQYIKSSSAAAHSDYFNSAKKTAYLLNSSGNTVFPGSCTATSHPTSSDRKKKDIHGELSLAAAKAIILRLNPVRYNFKGSLRECMGFVAQDAYKVMRGTEAQNSALYQADLITQDEDKAKDCMTDEEINATDDAQINWSMDYTQLIAPLVKIIQDQEKRIAALEACLKGR